MSEKDFSQFEQKLNLHFKNKDLLREAFTHRSYINESKRSDLTHNERLEFLGDAVLELVVTDYLFKKYPDKTEGDLTSYRSALVNAVTLGEVARTLGMNEYLLLSKGEAKDTGKARQIILANTFEAIVGALYLDQKYAGAEVFIAERLLPLTEEIVEKELWKDAKSFLQEKAQEEMGVTPTYKVVREVGPDHDKKFVVAVLLGDELVAEAQGKSKQEAEQGAAAVALKEKGWNMDNKE
ncbi:MAG: ribonuclease III [Candidatus Yonathbacteria bacterium]|nr:ribonuclease III [Candidatus Yonathbacteria bacterium]